MNKTSVLLAAAVLAGPAFAQANDDCAGAIALTAGAATAYDSTLATDSPELWPCAGTGGADLWYTYTSTVPGADIIVETCGSSYDTALEIFSGTCGALVSEICNDDFCGLQSTASVIPNMVGDTYFIRVGGFNAASGTGTILVTEAVVIDPCAMPDALEVNTDCASATALVDGTYTMLNVEDADNDYYAVTVPNGGSLTVDALFVSADGDVDVYLWDPMVACDTQVLGTGATTGFLARGFSASDDENVVYDNLSGADQSLIIEVDMWTAGGCNSYDLIIAGAGVGDGGIGSAYCTANPNSTGGASSILASGSSTVANNDVTLTATGLPMNAFGFFITSLTQGFVMNPAGSAGNLCLGGAIGRYVGPGQIMSSGATDTIALTIDLTMVPTPTGPVAVAPGENWNYQLWHRDSSPAGPTSNFTDGYSVTYN